MNSEKRRKGKERKEVRKGKVESKERKVLEKL